MRFLFFLITFFIFSLLTIHHSPFTREAAAASNFSISYDNIYEVINDSTFNVTQNVAITNLTTQYYVAELTISIGNTKVENVTARDESGPIPAETNFSGSQTNIKLTFNTPVVGKNKVKNFSLNYSAPELINKSGEILEISIPKLAEAENIDKFDVKLIVPTAVGPAAFISPEPKSAEIEGFGGKNRYFFDKGQLLKSGISAAFGEKQIFSFTLVYHLLNPKSVQTEIALPPDNAYQKVFITSVTPEPENVRVDSDGNWLAVYQLNADKQKDVVVKGFIEVYPKPKFKSQVGKDDLTAYLKPQQYWEVNNDFFIQKAKELKTPSKIYEYVTSLLSYNQQRLENPTIERIGAAAAVKNPKNAVCMEFTDLFITLSRAAGIPAREINGYAVSENERLRPLSLRNFGGDILHAWPEYWDEKLQTWVQVDPTWGSTSGGLDYFSKMDFNHISFVHKGLSSTYPIPAGGYKIDKNQSGDVKVEFAKKLPPPKYEPRLSLDFPKTLFSGLTAEGKILISNLSNQAITPAPLELTTDNINLKTPREISLGTLPPYSKREIEVKIASDGLLTSSNAKIEARLDSLVASSQINVRPSVFLLIIVVLIGFIVLAAGGLGGVFLFRKFFPKLRS